MDETIEYCFQDNGKHFSAACGGPIFVSNHVGPMTSVPDFKASVLQELLDLEAELVLDDDSDEELLIDDLKVFTEEELVEKALKEEFEHAFGNDESLQILEQANSVDDQVTNLNKEIISSTISINGNSNLESSTLLNDSSMLICDTDVSEKKVQQKRSKKRGRCFDRNARAAELEGVLVVGLLLHIMHKAAEGGLSNPNSRMRQQAELQLTANSCGGLVFWSWASGGANFWRQGL